MQEKNDRYILFKAIQKFMMRGNYLCTARRRIQETCCIEKFSEFDFTTDHMHSIIRKD